MMARSDFIDARWGDATARYVSPDQVRRCDARLGDVWPAIRDLTGSSADPPWIENVHTPRALPALVRFRGEPTAVVWDAGLGTLFDAFAFPLPFNQPTPVVEALLRRVTAVRLVLTGRAADGAAQLTRADTLLAQTPIDRSYQTRVDAEEQFEVFLLTELQERFALGHELSHFLREADPGSFIAFADRVVAAARAASVSPDPETVLSDEPGEPSYDQLYGRDLDPYAWYLYTPRSQVRVGISPRHDWSAEAAHVLCALSSANQPQVEEVLCDVLAALAVSLAAHRRQLGWTAIMAAACSRLALTHLETLLSIDRWAADQTMGTRAVEHPVSTRQRCVDVLLPQMLPGCLDAHGGGSRLHVGDVHAVMHLVDSVHEHRFGSALTLLSHVAPSPADRELREATVLARAGFVLLRPDADHKSTNRTAGGHKFELGDVVCSGGVDLLLRNSPFRQELEGALARHQRGDWGDMPPEDRLSNDAGLFQEFMGPDDMMPGQRDLLWSQYTVCGETVWVITSPNRSRTQVLLDWEH